MKASICSILLPLFFTISGVSAEDSRSELEQRSAEQERQIRQLEIQNLRLREQIERLQEKLALREEADGLIDTPSQPEPLTAAAPAEPAAVSSPTPEPEAALTHVVRAGESLSLIAKEHGTTTRELAKLNGIKNPALIRQGQRLKLPSDTPAPASAPAATTVQGTHRVKSGETFYSIAKTYGLSVEALGAANPGVDPKELRVGQELKLSARAVPSHEQAARETSPASVEEAPAPAKAPARSVVRKVHVDKRITFGEFARDHRMEPAKLNALNGLNLEPNQILDTGSRLYVSAQPLQ